MYKMMGADGKEYGPVTPEQLREWISQGRANGQTMVSFEGGPWKPLSTFPEYTDVLRSIAPPPLSQAAYVGAQGVAPKTNGFAMAGLIFSVLGLFCCGVFGAAVGLVLAIIGLNQINNNPQAYTTTKTMPIVAIALAIVDFILFGILYSTGVFERMLQDLKF